jgi:hypothetical protein
MPTMVEFCLLYAAVLAVSKIYHHTVYLDYSVFPPLHAIFSEKSIGEEVR